MSGMPLEARIKRLEDMEDIRRMIAEYARGADRHNDEAVTRALFAVDAVWESPQFGRYEGLEKIVEATTWGGREVIVWSLHYMVAPIVQVDESGERAHAHWYLWEPMKLRHPDGETADTWFGATYEARLRKRDGQWKIAHLILDTKLLAGKDEPWPGALANQVLSEQQIGQQRAAADGSR